MSKNISSENRRQTRPNVEEISINDEKKSTRSRTFFGKRFARRAKRWAEIQQRRQSSASDPPDSPAAESESFQEVQHEKLRNHKEHKPQKQYYTPNRYYGYSRSTFSPQDYFVQYAHPKGYIFYNPNIAWNECYYRPSYTTEQLVRGLSNLNFCAQETDGNATSESPNSLSSTSSLSTSYSSQYSFDDYLTTEQGANNFPAISAKTRKLCSELFLVPESKYSIDK
jgi:hypothetical protein